MTETETLVGQAAVEAIMRRIAREEIAAAGRAILAEQASDLRQGDGKTLRRYRPGGYGNMVASADGTYVYGPDADIIISAERAAREKAEAEVTRLKAVSEGYRLDAEEAEAELADLRKRVLAEVDRIFPAGGTLWINGDDHAGFKQITRIVDGLNRIRALLTDPKPEPTEGVERGSTGSEDKPATDAQRARSNPGGSSSAATLKPGPVVSTPTSLPAQDGDEPPASATDDEGIALPPEPERVPIGIVSSPEREAAIREMLTALEMLNNWPNPFNRVSDAAVRAQFIPALKAARAAGIKGSADDA
jgi:hypothetical protein